MGSSRYSQPNNPHIQLCTRLHTVMQHMSKCVYVELPASELGDAGSCMRAWEQEVSFDHSLLGEENVLESLWL